MCSYNIIMISCCTAKQTNSYATVLVTVDRVAQSLEWKEVAVQ